MADSAAIIGIPDTSSMENVSMKNALETRYASKAMRALWSPQFKFPMWRRCWLALAKAEKELGVPIAQEQLDEMEANLDNIDFEYAAEQEKKLRHDVMAHVHTFGHQCPKAMPIIHLGATSCYVVDNTELVQIREALKIIRGKMVKLVSELSKFAAQYGDMPTLGFTHYQPAQLTTVGKRATLWLQDMIFDLDAVDRQLETLPFGASRARRERRRAFSASFQGIMKR